jgi:hypothetical protein
MRILKFEGYALDNHNLLCFYGRIYMSSNEEIHNLILRESHRVVYMAHLGVKKMNAYLKPLFF